MKEPLYFWFEPHRGKTVWHVGPNRVIRHGSYAAAVRFWRTHKR